MGSIGQVESRICWICPLFPDKSVVENRDGRITESADLTWVSQTGVLAFFFVSLLRGPVLMSRGFFQRPLCTRVLVDQFVQPPTLHPDNRLDSSPYLALGT
jgi:hypothetical protein